MKCEFLCYNYNIVFGTLLLDKEEAKMRFSYNKLWKILIDKNMMKKDLMEQAKMTSSTLAKLGKNQPISMEVLGRICQALGCNIGDIVDVYFDD